ncbi:arginine beta-hydroxylase, Fe(II)/alpha-ketoglutarate-dependent [Nonomuraea turkmeniaca]|uniref:Arginine beta-hydroxylase, Fe(II)/alpha-ketoglutarate-dependent n=2 Tax=Nonomuraea turkmeniaca TaxID=103838 RepID=A0A5S4GEC1_9ACTN|nr:arginine beta-hydroxylase, Fe(II)/alpha-ketoglutarate-dependent [Nonomuraea turkmeniaca]
MAIGDGERMYEIRLSGREVEVIEGLLARMAERYRTVEDDEFLRNVNVHAHELPVTVRRGLVEFRMSEPAGVCLVTGFPVDDTAIGATPRHWAGAAEAKHASAREEFYFTLCASLLGDVFGWASQQGGRLVHEVLPIRGHESRQINSSSDATLLWHTEDAFHPYRADYVALMCLRNPGGTETTFACLDDVVVSRDVREILAQPRFVLRPDESHRPENAGPGPVHGPGLVPVAPRSYARIERLLRNPEKTPVLFGDLSSPYVRLDSDAVDWDIDDPEALSALRVFVEAVDKAIAGYSMRPGELLFVDNYRAVHGRRPFVAAFDGNDRWLKRLNISRDLRRSRDARSAPDARVVY